MALKQARPIRPPVIPANQASLGQQKQRARQAQLQQLAQQQKKLAAMKQAAPSPIKEHAQERHDRLSGRIQALQNQTK